MVDPSCKLSWAVGKKTVLCVGSANVDCISMVKRFPKPNVPEQSTNAIWTRGGMAANICTVLRNLGASVEFFGVLSSLPMFSLLLQDMRMRGIETDNCPRCHQEPPFSSLLINESTGSCTVVNCYNSFPYPTLEDFQKLDLSKYGWIHFRCRQPEVTIEMMRTVESYNATQMDQIVISMDFDALLHEHWKLVNYCEYVFFYREVAEELKWKTLKEACFNIDELLRMRFGINLKRPFIIFRWDLRHTGLMDTDSKFSVAPAYKANVFRDSHGIGQVFIGAFIYAIYVRGRTEAIAADFASRMATYKCIKIGFDHIADILEAPRI